MRGTLALLGLLLVLCGVYWGLHYWRTQQAQEREEVKKLFSFGPEAVAQLSIHRLGEDPSVATRAGEGTWEIVAPHPDIRPMHQLWDRVAQHLAELKNQRTIGEAEGDLKAYGLAEPALVVQAEVEGETPLTVEVGALDPTERFRYAQVNDGEVFLIDKNAHFELNRGMEELRHRFLVNDPKTPLDYFEFVRIWTGREEGNHPNPPAVGEESVRVVLEREGAEAPWVMKEPVGALANQEMAEKLVNEIQYGVGRNFVDHPESLMDYGLEPPTARITVEDVADSGTQTFEIGEVAASGDKGGLYVRRLGEDSVFVMDAQLLMELPRSPDALRERRLLTQQAMDLAKIEYTGPDTSFTLERGEDDQWRLSQPEAADVDQTQVSNYISALKTVQGIAFLDGPPEAHGLATPEVTIKLYPKEGGEPSSILLTPEPDIHGFYLVTQDTGQVVRVPENTAQMLFATPGQLRSRELMRFDKAQAARLELMLDGTPYVLEKVHGRWLVRVPDGMAVQSENDVDALLSALSPLVAVDAATGADPANPGYGLQAPVAVVEVDVAAEGTENGLERVETLTIGKPREDDAQQRYVQVTQREGVFTIRQDVVEALRRLVNSLAPAGAVG